MPEYSQRDEPFPAEQLDKLRETVLRSPFVGSSPLSGTFEASRGFSLIFRRDGLFEVQRRFANIVPFVDIALDPTSAASLLSGWRRLIGFTKQPNAFYLNLLMVPAGAEVGPHIDVTLRSHCTDESLVANMVSVLYVRVPEGMRGGELRLARQGRPVAALEPREGHILHFKGDLTHAVGPVEHPDPEAVRISLVLEQYIVSPDTLAELPRFKIHSKAGFDAYLLEQRQRPPKRFVLE